MRSIRCPYCKANAELVDGSVIYPHRADLFSRLFWRCAPCDAYVGTHRNSPDHAPLGRLADAELRAAKRQAHDAFDPLWQGGGMNRRQAYKWLSEALDIPRHQTHIGMFNVAQCHAVIAAVQQRSLTCHG